MFRQQLLAWYEREGRTLPWRVRPEDRQNGVRPDAYKVWLSEIMLQQTTIPHATPYWQTFTQRWPTVNDLARADRDQVMAAWAGLGYYARARNMHACACQVSAQFQGLFPDTIEGLKALPGIGDYTANAIAAIVYDRPGVVVDGNVERVISRLERVETPLPKAKPEIKALAAELSDPDRPGDYAQAIMDLGAVICTPKSPSCSRCPVSRMCKTFKVGDVQAFPRKQKKAKKPVRYGTCFHVLRDKGEGQELLVRRRPDKGLLGGMLELPGTDWNEEISETVMPFKADWQDAGEVRHVFTHFELRLRVFACDPGDADYDPFLKGQWVRADSLKDVGLPSVMLKAARLGLSK